MKYPRAQRSAQIPSMSPPKLPHTKSLPHSFAMQARRERDTSLADDSSATSSGLLESHKSLKDGWCSWMASIPCSYCVTQGLYEQRGLPACGNLVQSLCCAIRCPQIQDLHWDSILSSSLTRKHEAQRTSPQPSLFSTWKSSSDQPLLKHGGGNGTFPTPPPLITCCEHTQLARHPSTTAPEAGKRIPPEFVFIFMNSP